MRERRLTREETVGVLDRRARQMGIKDFALSLRQLDRWLARDVGDPRSVRCRVVEAEFGHPIERLLSPVQEGGSLKGCLKEPASPREHFGAIVSHLAQIDHEVGASSALRPATEVCRSLLAAADQSSGRDRDDCLRLSARCAELVGWFHQDAGSPHEARAWTGRALDLAEAADAQEFMAYLLMRRSAVAADLGLADEALLLAEGALRRARHGGERALAFREVAVAHALDGDGPALRRAVDTALESIRTTSGPDELAPYCSISYIQSEAGSAALTLGDPGLAVEYLEPAAAGWPGSQRRDRAVCLARLALAQARRGELDRAEATAQRASEAAVGCGSIRFDRTLRSTIEAIRNNGGEGRATALADIWPR